MLDAGESEATLILLEVTDDDRYRDVLGTQLVIGDEVRLDDAGIWTRQREGVFDTCFEIVGLEAEDPDVQFRRTLENAVDALAEYRSEKICKSHHAWKYIKNGLYCKS